MTAINFEDFLNWLRQQKQTVTEHHMHLLRQFFTDGVLDMLGTEDPELVVQTLLINYLTERGVHIARVPAEDLPEQWVQYALQMALAHRPDRATAHELMQLVMQCIMLCARAQVLEVSSEQKIHAKALMHRALDLAVEAATRMLLVDKYSEEALAKVTHQQPRQVM